MATDSRPSPRIQRFRQLPVLGRETWQGGLVRLPMWVGKKGEVPFRPWGAIWVSLSTGRMTIRPEPGPGAHGPELLFEALLDFAQQERKVLHGRAGRLQVPDRALRDALEAAIGEADVHVEAAPRVEAVAEVLRAYTDHADPSPVPAALDGAGVTIDAMRQFADAAAAFYRAAPWQHLSDQDAIAVESDVPSPWFRYAVVLGNAGYTFGVGFYRESEDFEAAARGEDPDELVRRRGTASVLFDTGDGIPLADHDLWVDHDLPLAGPRAYPFAAHYLGGRRVNRPDREELVFLEALLRALAETTEEEMDSGRWTKKVTAGGGRTRVRLALPGVLLPARDPDDVVSNRRAMERIHAEIGRFLSTHEFKDLDEANRAIAERFSGRPMEATPSTASTPLERAQDLCYEAYEARGRRRTALARQALALSPDCAEAYVILAEAASSPERALDLYEQGVAAGRRAIGGEYEALAGSFWGRVETRPYMRALMGRANVLADAGRQDEAIAGYQELVRLNPGDNQGARYLLMALLLERGRDGDAARLFDQYPEDIAASFLYARALWTFRTGGDSPEARAALAEALKTNPHAPEYLLDPDLVDDEGVDHFEFGSEEEAIVCADEIGAAWRAAPGALDWLRERVRERRKERAAKRRARKGGRRRR